MLNVHKAFTSFVLGFLSFIARAITAYSPLLTANRKRVAYSDRHIDIRIKRWTRCISGKQQSENCQSHLCLSFFSCCPSPRLIKQSGNNNQQRYHQRHTTMRNADYSIVFASSLLSSRSCQRLVLQVLLAVPFAVLVPQFLLTVAGYSMMVSGKSSCRCC